LPTAGIQSKLETAMTKKKPPFYDFCMVSWKLWKNCIIKKVLVGRKLSGIDLCAVKVVYFASGGVRNMSAAVKRL